MSNAQIIIKLFEDLDNPKTKYPYIKIGTILISEIKSDTDKPVFFEVIDRTNSVLSLKKLNQKIVSDSLRWCMIAPTPFPDPAPPAIMTQ